jgi:hypothetical protein
MIARKGNWAYAAPVSVRSRRGLLNSQFARVFGFLPKAPDIQKQLDEGHARFMEFQKELDERRSQSGRNAD